MPSVTDASSASTGDVPPLTVTVVRSDDLDGRAVRELLGLWAEAFGERFGVTDAEHALGGVHVLAHEGVALVSHAAVVPRVLVAGDQPLATGYVEAVATAPSHQGRGAATTVMRAVEEVIREQYALGALSTGLPGFYARLGWARWQGPSYVVRGGEWVRTPGDDDGVMVLRFGPSATLDLTGPLACDHRSGDVW